MTGGGTSRTPSPTTVHRTHPQGDDAHSTPPDKCAFCGGTHGSRPTGYAGHAGRDVGTPPPTTAHRTHPQGDDAHSTPSDKCAFCGGTHGSRPTGYTGHAGRDVGTPSPTTVHRAHPQGTMPTHRPADSIKRQAQAPASLSKKSGWTFSASWQAKSQNKNDILFCDFGRCGG